MTIVPSQSKMQALRAALERARPSIAAVAPRGTNAERIIKAATVAVANNPELLKCDVKSLVVAVIQATQLGLDCSGVLGQGWIVPFYNEKKQMTVATFIPGYRGLITLARRSGEIEDLYAHVVYEGDDFAISYGDAPSIRHVPAINVPRDDSKIIGAYMVAWLRGSSRPHLEWMQVDEIQRVRQMSRSPNSPMWTKSFPEACRKTVFRRGIKSLPLRVDDPLGEAVAMEDAAESGDPVGDEVDIEIDVGPEVPAPSGQVAAPALAEKIRRTRKGQGQSTGPVHMEEADGGQARPSKVKVPTGPEGDQGPTLFPQGQAADWSDPIAFLRQATKVERQIEEAIGPEKTAKIKFDLLGEFRSPLVREIPVERRQEFLDRLYEVLDREAS